MTVETPPPRLVRLLLDAYEEFERAAEAVPTPGQGGAIGRLNPAGWIVAHVANQQDAFWNATAQGFERDPWLRETAAEPPTAPPYTEAMTAWRRVTEVCVPYLETLDEARLAAVLHTSSRGVERTAGDMVTRSIAHVFVHAGELATIASLVGTPDLGLPGALPRSTSEGA